MIDERREAQASLYALGALPVEEVFEFETAMRADLQLQLLVNQLRAASGALVFAFPRIDPLPELKQRVMAAVAERNPAPVAVVPVAWPQFIPWALAACFALLCVILLMVGQSLRQQSFALQEQLQENQQKLAELETRSNGLAADFIQRSSNLIQQVILIQTQLVQRAEEIRRQKQNYEQQLQQAATDGERQKAVYVRQMQQALADRDSLKQKLDQVTSANQDTLSQMRVAVLNATPDNPSRATAASVWDPTQQRGVLQVENLAPLPPASDYQLWLFDPQYPTPVSGGAFSVEPTGSAYVQFTAVARIAQAQRFAVSIERKGGASVPTPGKVVLISSSQ